MNAKLGELLTAAGLRGDPLRWSAVLIAHNLGAIPPPARSEADEIRHRGFYLLLLDGHGKPTHFCKCRPVTDDELTHETALLEVLCADPHLRTIVPQTRGVRTRQMLMQVSAYLPGPTYLREVGRQSDRAWEQSMREILGAAGLLAERAMALAPWLAADSEPLKLQSLGSGPLQELVALGLTPERANALEQAMERAGGLNRRVQHGDLFPGNIIRWAGSWWLLDLARYGSCQVPMFDAYNLVRSCCELRQAGSPSLPIQGWYAQMAIGGRVATTAQRTLAWVARESGLTPARCLGALTYYSVEFTAHLIRRRSPQPIWAPLLAHTRLLADALLAGDPVERVFFGAR